MNIAQSPHVPPSGTRPGIGDLPWLVLFSTRGLVELVRARVVFTRLKARDILARNQKAKEAGERDAMPETARLARIAYVIPRISNRLPWRSDCLIQAIAAQNWLSNLGFASEIRIGVENPKDGQFGAHAWLVCDGEVITGGDIERYHLLLADSRHDASEENEPHGNEL